METSWRSDRRGYLDAYRPWVTPTGSETFDPDTAFGPKNGANQCIDSAAVYEVLGLRYMLGNRTIVSDVKRGPWRNASTDYSDLPAHGSNIVVPEQDAARLLELLTSECLYSVREYKCVGILLSGGMDSRIAAGVLRTVQRDLGLDVVAFTWGMADSRDVIYGQRIAQIYGWDWQHLPLTPDLLRENIEECGRIGVECSPLHLHAMRTVRNTAGIEALVAASFGDSIGRGEYSRIRVENLRPIIRSPVDRFALLGDQLLEKCHEVALRDAYGARHDAPHREEAAWREVDQQQHYMSRMLCVGMQTACWPKPVIQIFASPDVYGFAWQFAMQERDDRLYAQMIRSLPGDLAAIPWARNGLAFGGSQFKPDSLRSTSHLYGRWLREDLREEILQRVRSDALRSLELFPEDSIERLISIWMRGTTDSPNWADEAMAWLAGLSGFVRRYGITRSDASGVARVNWRRVAKAEVWALGYMTARNRLRG